MSTSFFDDDDGDDTQLLPAGGPVAAPAVVGDNDEDDEFQLPPRLRGAESVAAAAAAAAAGAGGYNARAGPSSRPVRAPARHHVREASTLSRIDMDLDVDDLVGDIIAPNDDDGRTRNKRVNAGNDEEDSRESEVDRLMRRWMDERMAPELLRCDEELMGSLMERLEAQVRSYSRVCFLQRSEELMYIVSILFS